MIDWRCSGYRQNTVTQFEYKAQTKLYGTHVCTTLPLPGVTEGRLVFIDYTARLASAYVPHLTDTRQAISGSNSTRELCGRTD